MRKGLSELLGATFALAITLSIAGVYSTWAPQFSGDTAENIANKSNNDIKCRNAAAGIKNMEYDRTAGNVTFDLENRGTISFYKDLTVVAINSSTVVAQKDIKNLEVGETQKVELSPDKIPDEVIGSSTDCPGLTIREDSVNVTK